MEDTPEPLTPIEVLEKHQQIVGLLRYTYFPKIQHYEKYSKRTTGVLKKLAISELFVTQEITSHYAYIRVWGNGLTYGQAFYMQFNHTGEWQEKFMRACKEHNPLARIERLKAEATIHPQLAELKKMVDAARAKAAGLVEALPLPTKALASLGLDEEDTAKLIEKLKPPSPYLFDSFPGLFDPSGDD